MDKQDDKNKAKPQSRDYVDKNMEKSKTAGVDKTEKGGSGCGC